jgi:hypothetical protein
LKRSASSAEIEAAGQDASDYTFAYKFNQEELMANWVA